MRKLLVLISFIATTTLLNAQIPAALHGLWVNEDNELLTIQPNNTFVRQTATNPSTIISRGELKADKKTLFVLRTDNGEEYSLQFYVGEEVFVVSRPGSPERAWLFQRLN